MNTFVAPEGWVAGFRVTAEDRVERLAPRPGWSNELVVGMYSEDSTDIESESLEEVSLRWYASSKGEDSICMEVYGPSWTVARFVCDLMACLGENPSIETVRRAVAGCGFLDVTRR